MNKFDPKSDHTYFFSMLDDLTKGGPHDCGRYQTTDGLDNADFTNGDRVSTALEALACFQVSSNMDVNVDTAASDLIGDLLHLIHSRGHDPKFVLQNGLGHFLCEAGSPASRGRSGVTPSVT